MSDCLDLNDFIPLIKETLESGGEFHLAPHGRSMLPTIRENTDTVILSTPIPIKKGDILLYKRKNGQVVLHRLISKKGSVLVFSGDAQNTKEFGITEADIIAKVTKIVRRGRKIAADSFFLKLTYSLVACRRGIWTALRFCKNKIISLFN